MEKQLKDHLRQLMGAGTVEGVIALKNERGMAKPYLFTSADELEDVCLDPKYPMASVVRLLQAEYPDASLAVVCRGCDERAILELVKRNQVDDARLTIVGVACDEETAKDCNCVKPYTTTVDIGTPLADWEAERLYEDYKAMTTEERLVFWKYQLEKCNKCYGCRNACPMCFCKDCELENALWVKRGRLPPEFPIYHMIRAFHLAGKCIACGECEKACPAGIPLMVLNRLLREDMEELFGFVSGEDKDTENPLYTKEEME